MAGSIDKTFVINMALVKIGAGPMFSTNDNSPLGRNIEHVWQTTVDFAFALDDWIWAKRTRKLLQQAETPENGWRWGYDLPSERVGPAVRFLDQAGHSPSTLRNYHLEGKSVFANVEHVWAEIRLIVPVDDWEAEFRSAFVTLLASELAVPVFQEGGLRDQLRIVALGTPQEKMTGGMFGRLMAQNKAAAPIGAEPMMANTPLDDARHGGGSGFHDWAGKYG